MNKTKILFIHGSESNSQTYKAQVFQKIFPEIIIPDFTGPLSHRLVQISEIVKNTNDWTLIGSSLGGLIAAMFTLKHPDQVGKLVLLSPALHLPEFSRMRHKSVRVPAILILGKKDDIIPIDLVKKIATHIFPRLTYLSVDDDHRLHYIVDILDWKTLLE